MSGPAAAGADGVRPVEPVFVAGLLRPLSSELIRLLRGLACDDWLRPTRAGDWRVRDVAAHLLDVDCRKLSLHRDAMPLAGDPPRDEGALLALLNRLNAEWVAAASRIGPRLLTDLLELTGCQVADYLESLDPFGRARFPVAWAGEAESAHWFDIGREFTERWHHQQQIREAIGAPLLTEARWLRPAIEVSLRALPHAYRSAAAAPGTAVVVEIRGASGGAWSLVRNPAGWGLFVGASDRPTACARLDEDTAWRLLLKAIDPELAAGRLEIEGDRGLGSLLLSALAVMA